jgi:hypothetical protein
MDRFWSKVEKTDSCWNWTASKFHHGYGSFGVKQPTGKYKIHYAHRVSYVIEHGSITDGLCVLHSCDNRACVNPAHLWLGTQAQNVADAVAKGRMRTTPRYGESNSYSKLTEADVIAIRKIGSSRPQATIAKEFGVTQSLIGYVIRRTIWKHVE